MGQLHRYLLNRDGIKKSGRILMDLDDCERI